MVACLKFWSRRIRPKIGRMLVGGRVGLRLKTRMAHEFLVVQLAPRLWSSALRIRVSGYGLHVLMSNIICKRRGGLS